jgi:hypothetical protein
MVIGEYNGELTDRIRTIKKEIEKAEIIVEISDDIDAWLKCQVTFSFLHDCFKIF